MTHYCLGPELILVPFEALRALRVMEIYSNVSGAKIYKCPYDVLQALRVMRTRSEIVRAPKL